MAHKDKEASKEYHKEYYKRKKCAYRESVLKQRYGITLDDYQELSKEQNHVCAICGNAETATFNNKPRALCVDHCHQSGSVRGLLCNFCNAMLGHARDNPEILIKGADYLNERGFYG
ncbi:endonuclease VII domain-containing protein [Salmonella enterica]|nr:endonuclease VII domain-containing protein [Salmonella enterica]